MWSRDEWREQPCGLFDVQLPPFPASHWLGNWEIDYTNSRGRVCASNHLRLEGSAYNSISIDQLNIVEPQSFAIARADSAMEISVAGRSVDSSDAPIVQIPSSDSNLYQKGNWGPLKGNLEHVGCEANIIGPPKQIDEAGWLYAPRLNST